MLFQVYYAWIHDSVFIPVQFHETGKDVIIFTNSRSRKWSILEFAFDFAIHKLQPVSSHSLMVSTYNEKRKQIEVLKIPIR